MNISDLQFYYSNRFPESGTTPEIFDKILAEEIANIIYATNLDVTPVEDDNKIAS